MRQNGLMAQVKCASALGVVQQDFEAEGVAAGGFAYSNCRLAKSEGEAER